VSTEIALQGLDGMEIQPGRLKVRKASSGIAQVAGEMGVNAMSMLAGTTAVDPDLSRVVQLLNMVTPEELMDQQDYEGWCLQFPYLTTASLTFDLQKSRKTWKRSAQNTARSSRSLSRGLLAPVDNQQAWARSLSSTRRQRQRLRLYGRWLEENSRIGLSSQRISPR
jgi:hypothetical protein